MIMMSTMTMTLVMTLMMVMMMMVMMMELFTFCPDILPGSNQSALERLICFYTRADKSVRGRVRPTVSSRLK